MKHSLRFLREFFLNPGITGAIAPSSRTLAREMVASLEFDSANAVLEYGPGTGAFTEAVLAQLRPECSFFMIELNSLFVELLQVRYPGKVIFKASVKDVRKLCDRQGIAQVDCIVSGLPWAWFPDGMQTQYLDAMMTVLRPGGQFVTFAYLQGLLLPAGQRFRRKLDKYFSRVVSSRTVWLNLPPAFVYRCRR
jgi:phosphatidylethanolamine/phosphatidyl-N-methylethanolamine N-methyltransferase